MYIGPSPSCSYITIFLILNATRLCDIYFDGSKVGKVIEVKQSQ